MAVVPQVTNRNTVTMWLKVSNLFLQLPNMTNIYDFTRCHFICTLENLCTYIGPSVRLLGCFSSQLGGSSVTVTHLGIAPDSRWYKVLLLLDCSMGWTYVWVLLCICTSFHVSE